MMVMTLPFSHPGSLFVLGDTELHVLSPGMEDELYTQDQEEGDEGGVSALG